MDKVGPSSRNQLTIDFEKNICAYDIYMLPRKKSWFHALNKIFSLTFSQFVNCK